MEKTHSWEIDGMTCGNCALTISKYLNKQGFTDVSANAGSGEVIFTAEEDVDLDKIQKGIKDLGYQVIKKDGQADESMDYISSDRSSKILRLLIVSALFTIPLLFHMFVGHDHMLNNPWLQLILCIPVYGIGVYHFGVSAYRSLKNGIPNMDVLIILGTTAAFVYSIIGIINYQDQAHNYLFFETAATIITFVLLGNWIEERTVTATTSSIKELAKLQPSKARVVMTDSIGKESIMEVDSKYVKLDDIVMVNDGEGIPVDGEVVAGYAEVNESMISGESLPVEKSVGSGVTGGSILTSGNIRVKATAIGSETALSEIIRLVQKAQAAKPPMQKLADRISAIFVPAVLIIAIITFIANYFLLNSPDSFQESIMRAIAVLVIACPCAMGLATPAAVAVGLGRAAKNGILIKGGETLEKFKDIRQVVFDKTGTLTTGDLIVQDFELFGIQEQEFKSIVASLEQYSTHPIAKSILKQWSGLPIVEFEQVEEIKGMGLEAKDNSGNIWKLGSYKILPHGVSTEERFDLHLLKNNQLIGSIQIQDELREDAKATVDKLHDQGYHTIILSGDRKLKVDTLARELGIDEVIAEQSPNQKMQHLERLIHKSPTIMVGDGINDAPALAKADIGVSLSDATKVAMQSANVVLSNNHLSTLPKAIRLGKLTYLTIKQNLFWAFFYNVIFIPFAAFGFLSPIWAAVIMAMSDVVLIINSVRLKFRNID